MQHSNFGIKDAGMDSWRGVFLTFFERFDPTALDGAGLEQIEALLDDVPLDQPTVPGFRVGNGVQFVTVQTVATGNKSTCVGK